jgi:AcrR family transcriptional regulator
VAGVDARESLLDAAVVLFAEKGVAGTTVAEIAARANLTPAMVHYYFTNRDRLLDAVARERIMRAVTAVWGPVVDSTEVGSMVRGIVQRIVTATQLNPWLPSLWLREVVSERGLLRPRLLKMLPLDLLSHLVAAVTAASKRGETVPGLEPRLLLISVMGLTMLPLATMSLWQQIPALKGITRADVARHAEALLVGAVSRSARRAAAE